MTYREVFGEILADHHESPRNWGKLGEFTSTSHGYNPVCGDKIDVWVKVEGSGGDAKLSKCGFEGEGCSICLASASIMSEKVEGQPVSRVLGLVEGFREKM